MTAMAQTTVTVEKAGTLSSMLENTATSVKVTGPLNGTDIKYLRDLVTGNSLTSIDLSEARIVSGGVAYFEDKTTANDVIGEAMFKECKKLTSFILPYGITSIGTNAFARSGLTKVEIPNYVTTVGNDAFAYCSSLATVVIGKRVAKMSQGVFYSSPVKNAYFKPMVPPSSSSYEFSSSPQIHVYAAALADYKASGWNSYGTLVGDLEKTHPYEKEPDEIAAEKFVEYFDDVLCTQMKAAYAGMSDEDLTALLTEEGMTDAFINIALKIKNNTWAPYEKDFRIHSYKAYSDATYWNDKMKSTGGSFMGNPTGIYVKGAENLYVFVGDDIPSDATLYLAGCVENSLVENAKTGTKLEKGLNVISGTKDALYYVVYTANTKAMTKKLSEWPMMNIHIEGGVVNGYYELSRHSDKDYKAILAAATHKRFTVKGDESLFNFKTATYREIWPNAIDKSICWFDSLTVWQKELMGFCEAVALGERDFYPHNLSGGEAIFPIYYNNPNFAIEGEQADAGWANSTPYRTSYNSVGCVRSAFNVYDTANLDDWCSAHECGHNNQSTISLEGCTEVSNNLFSNMVRFIDGIVTSTGTTPTTTMNDYTEHIPFYIRNINERIRMYYQLYLYFHQARKNTAFYPTLFQELRKSPLSLYQTYNNNGGLKFVRTVCNVAQQDLTDFFRAYGFFEPGKLTIDDYGTHQMNTRQYDIDRTLKEISQYPVKNREILFIEDRIEHMPTHGFPGVAGQQRRESDKVGQCGDLGQFTDYMKTPAEASSYTYLQSDSLYSMIGTGGVGFVVLDSEENLLYGSNAFTFCIPSHVGKDFAIYSIDADGTLHPTEKMGSGTQLVDMEKVGTLPEVLNEDMISVVVTGPINGTDIAYLRDQNVSHRLISIDLAGASIRSGGTAYYKTLRTSYNVFGEQMFYKCKKLQNIVLPKTITRIGKQALAETGIKSVVIPDLVTTIEGDAFAYNDDLKEVVVGEKVRTISQGAFYSSQVKDIYVKPATPPSVSSYLLSSNPIIHVRKSSLAKYEASSWAEYGTLVGDLDEWEEQQANAINLADAGSLKDISISQSGGKMQLTGLNGLTEIRAYTLDDIEIAKVPVVNGSASLDLTSMAGRIVIISTEKKNFKILIQKQ